MSNLAAFLWRHKFLSLLLIALIALVAYSALRPEVTLSNTTTVKRGDVIQEISVTGRVESERSADLAFSISGRVTSEPRAVGDRVNAGDVLVRLDASELAALRAQAVANLSLEEAKLAELNRGARPEDIAISEAQLSSARASLEDAEVALIDKLRAAKSAIEDAVYAKTDPLFNNPRTQSLRFTLPLPDQKLISQIESGRFSVGRSLDAFTIAEADLSGTTISGKRLLADVRHYLDDLLYGVTNMPPSTTYNQTAIDGWKTDIASARSAVSVAETALLAAEEKYRTQSNAVLVAERELAFKKAGVTPETLAQQEAKIASAKASVANYDAQIAKTSLVAPFEGVITRQDAKRGETVSANTAVVAMIADKQYKILANVAEADVAKIAVGNIARVTLDAYGSDVLFPAKVAKVDPAETVIQGVPTYQVTLYFDTPDERIRSGMTANTDILAERREQTLYLPTRTVVSEDGKKYVRTPLPDGTFATKTVETGLRGSDGYIEIISGLSEGDEVVVSAP